MPEQEAFAQLDVLLHPLVAAVSESAVQDELEALLALVEPLVKRITVSGRSPEDDRQECLRQMLVALQQCRQSPAQHAIGDLRRYVSVVASHVARRSWRQERPVFQQLKDSLRHMLRHDGRFALWQAPEGEWLCGLAVHRSVARPASSARLTILLADPLACDEEILPERDAAQVALGDLLTALLGWLGHALRFDQLTPVVFTLRRLREALEVTEDDLGTRELRGQLADDGVVPEQSAASTEFLGRLWEEIETLPLPQRIAYLLNFTAGEGALEIFWLSGIASLRRIGTALQLTDEQFARAANETDYAEPMRKLTTYDEKFALLWQHLPLDDLTIARLLDTERQKIINLRKAAGDRLARRLAAFRPLRR